MAINSTSAAGAVEIGPDLNVETKSREEDHQRIIESAKQFLGQGCCRRRKERRLSQIFPASEIKSIINVEPVQSLYKAYKVSFTNIQVISKEIADETHRSIGFSFSPGELFSKFLSPSLGSFNLSGSFDLASQAGSATSERSKGSGHYYVVHHIISNKCRLSNDLRPPEGNYDVDGYIRSGFAYVRYLLIFKSENAEEIEKGQDSGSSSAGGSLTVAVSKAIQGNVKSGDSRQILDSVIQAGESYFTSIELHGEGFVPTFSIPSDLKTRQEINQLADRVEKEFKDQLPKLQRTFYYDDNDIVSFPPLSAKPLFALPSPAPAASLSAPEVEPSIANSTQSQERSFTQKVEKVVEQICNHFRTPPLSILLEDLKNIVQAVDNRFTVESFLMSMCTQMQEILPIVVDAPQSDLAHVIVVGPTGAGKSALVGYLLGEDLVTKEVEKTVRVDYSNITQEAIRQGSKNLPQIGHTTSSTKGAIVHREYIDTGGLFDRKGFANDLVNSIAMEIAIQKHGTQQLKKLILMISPAVFENRNRDFLMYIDILEQCVADVADPEKWKHILFVFNDQSNSLTEDIIIRKIQSAKEQLKNELKSLIDQLPEELRNKWNAKPENLDEERRVSVSLSYDHILDQARKLRRQKDLLKLILKKKNFIAVDTRKFQDKTLRIGLQKWLNIQNGLKPEDFTMQRFVPNGNSALERFFIIVMSYFNHLIQTTQKIEEEMRTFNEKRTTCEQRIRELSSLLSGPGNSVKIEDIQTQWNTEFEAKKDCQRERAKLEKEKEDLINNSVSLLSSQKEVFLGSLNPQPSIQPRSRWAYFDFTATTYSFRLDNLHTRVRNVNVNPSEQKPRNKTCSPGEFINEVLNKDCFCVEFRPGYYGHQVDTQARVDLYVEERDHPKTRVAIALLKQKQAQHAAQIKALDQRIEAYDDIIARLQTDCQRSTIQVVVNMKQHDLTTCTQEYENAKLCLEEIKTQLQTFREFCVLLARVSKNIPNLAEAITAPFYAYFLGVARNSSNTS